MDEYWLELLLMLVLAVLIVVLLLSGAYKKPLGLIGLIGLLICALALLPILLLSSLRMHDLNYQHRVEEFALEAIEEFR